MLLVLCQFVCQPCCCGAMCCAGTCCAVLCPGYQLQGPDAVANSTKVLLTGDEQYILRIGPSPAGKSSSKMVLTDVQKSKATIVDGPFTPESTPGVSVFLIDKVLRSGECRRRLMHSSLVAVLHSTHYTSVPPAKLGPRHVDTTTATVCAHAPRHLCCLIPVSPATHATCMRPCQLCSQLLP